MRIFAANMRLYKSFLFHQRATSSRSEIGWNQRSGKATWECSSCGSKSDAPLIFFLPLFQPKQHSDSTGTSWIKFYRCHENLTLTLKHTEMETIRDTVIVINLVVQWEIKPEIQVELFSWMPGVCGWSFCLSQQVTQTRESCVKSLQINQGRYEACTP